MSGKCEVRTGRSSSGRQAAARPESRGGEEQELLAAAAVRRGPPFLLAAPLGVGANGKLRPFALAFSLSTRR